jgi:hypothetical protein
MVESKCVDDDGAFEWKIQEKRAANTKINFSGCEI